jgi:hypothetical protein
MLERSKMEYQLIINKETITLLSNEKHEILIDNIKKINSEIKKNISSLVVKDINNSETDGLLGLLSGLYSIEKLELVNIKAKDITSIFGLCANNQNLESISIDNYSQTDSKNKEYRIKTKMLKGIIDLIKEDFRELTTFDLISNISLGSIKFVKKELEGAFLNTMIENYNIQLVLPGKNSILKAVHYNNDNEKVKEINFLKNKTNLFFGENSKKRGVEEIKVIENDSSQLTKKLKLTPMDVIDLTDLEAKLLIKGEELFFTSDIAKDIPCYSKIFFQDMIELLIGEAKDIKGKLKLHVEQVTHEHLSSQIANSENEFYNIKNISEMTITLDDNKLHDSLIHLIKNNRLNVLSIFSESVLSNCDELLKAIIQNITNNSNIINQAIILELVLPESYDTKYLDQIQLLSDKNSKISFQKEIKYIIEDSDSDSEYIKELESLLDYAPGEIYENQKLLLGQSDEISKNCEDI